jgi:CubicO group peptidase (beta-lactamase class C family)
MKAETPAMKRLALVSILLVVAGAVLSTYRQDPLYWKRLVLSWASSPANRPAAYYEPTEVIEGSNGPSFPRVAPELEHLSAQALAAATKYAEEEGTLALVVARHGHVVYEKYWDGTTFDTVIDTGRFNAALTAIMVGMAIGDRKIALPIEPAANYIESFRENGRDKVTLGDLLQMTSGLGPDAPDADRSARHEELAHDIRNQCLEQDRTAAPGKRWQLQACDPQLLAHIIERATGMQYSQYVSSRVWKPIGAGDAWLMLDHEDGTAHASCCLRARLGDWMRVAHLLVNDGKYEGEQVLPPGWVHTMRTPSKANRRFGYQVWLAAPVRPGDNASEPYVLEDMFALKGPGTTRLWLVPSMNLSILCVGSHGSVGPDWDDSRIPNLIVRGASDYVPKAAKSGADVSNLVPNH